MPKPLSVSSTTMRLRHIEVFHAVMQAGSLSGAASLLNISQPAASKMLAQAEHSLGVALFKRLPSGLKPTPEAMLLFQETKTLHASLDRVRHLARNLASHPGGMLRIGCIPSLGLSLVPRAVAAFTRLCPEVSINIRTENQQTLSALLLAQEIDIGIAFEPAAMAGIAIEELGRARAVLFGAGSDWPAKAPVHLRELDLSKWISLDSMDPLGSIVNATLAGFDEAGRVPMIQVKTYYLARALVESGIGFTIIDEYTAQSAADTFAVRQLEPALSVGVCMMTSMSHAGTQGLKVFVEQLEKQLARIQSLQASELRAQAT
ncbi:LysR family transcriptional regulator [Paraburkholderia bryophila]|uniref:DNA-binding transcriptional LysR family regulator n=1 Tax=Paraburkholderia bryophila TaxID=420952 RepID=A0A7Y9WIT3_9BURK|nr:LysR family transcriptional regulator [Paraburkholderia bryophila]NYH21642.1 DNA-binding transcriptional LysR family regulator [Paraburkholderia bryophila]